jgi:hypothetical protein
MEQPRIRMRDSPLAELFRSTAIGARGDETTRASPAGERPRWLWRPTALAAFAIAILTLQLGIVTTIAATLLTRPGARATPVFLPPTVTRTIFVQSPSAPLPPVARKPVRQVAPRAQTPVLVLNGNGISGAAARAAEIVRARGYPVTATADAPTTYPRSVVMYKHGFRREAERLGSDLNLRTLQLLDPLAVPGGTRAQLVVIVGRTNT